MKVLKVSQINKWLSNGENKQIIIRIAFRLIENISPRLLSYFGIKISATLTESLDIFSIPLYKLLVLCI